MPVRSSVVCRCGGTVSLYLVCRTLVAVCAKCREARPARESPQTSRPPLKGGKS